MAWTNTDPNTTPATGFTDVNAVVSGTQLAEDVADLFCHIVWGTAAVATGSAPNQAIEITGTARDFNGSTLATDTVVVKVMVTGSANSLTPQGAVTLTAAAVPKGTTMDGSGTGTLLIETSTSGEFTVKVNQSAAPAATYYLHVMEGLGSQVHVRAGVAPQAITFA